MPQNDFFKNSLLIFPSMKFLTKLCAGALADQWIKSRDSVKFYHFLHKRLSDAELTIVLKSVTEKDYRFGLMNSTPSEGDTIRVYQDESGKELHVTTAVCCPDVFLNPEHHYGFPVHFVGLVRKWVRNYDKPLYFFDTYIPEVFPRDLLIQFSREKECAKNHFRSTREKNHRSMPKKHEFKISRKKR